MSDPIEVLDFWLGEIGSEGWYAGGAELDALIDVRFGDLWQALHDGGLDHWISGPAGALAYIVVADQFSRNIHRGNAKAFATDAKARAAARVALDNGWDMAAPEPERQFFYMPFEHSEDMADQDHSVTLMHERMSSDPELELHAKAHRLVIEQFGRFPFRNDALGRESTAAERAFLESGGYGSLVRQMKS